LKCLKKVSSEVETNSKVVSEVGGIKKIDFYIEEKTFKKKGNKGNGGLNKQQILMPVNTFKKLCMKANTKKAD